MHSYIMGIDVNGFTTENLNIRVEDETIIFSGTIDDVAPGRYLMPFFKAVSDAIIREKLKEVHVDIRNLQFINSSGIKEIIFWILKSVHAENSYKHKITFICNPEIEWQTASLAKVALLAPEFVEIKYEPL